MTARLFAQIGLALLLSLAVAAVAIAAPLPAHTQQPPRRTPPARPTGQPALPLTPTRSLALPTALPAITPTRTVARPTGLPALPLTPTRSLPLPTALPAIPPAVTPGAAMGDVTQVAEYAAADVLRTFAAQYLGLAVTVGGAAGASGSVAAPASVQSQIAAAAELAGQVSVGAITAGSARGAAEVAVGSGSISGDLDADISSAALGAYSLLVAVTPPRSSSAALDLVRRTYPGLAGVDLAQQSGGAGYVFRASTVTEGVDPRTLTVTAIVQEVLAGVTGQGRATVVWAVIGRGDFAAALALP